MQDKVFQSKYPLMLAAMNKVSDLPLAIASSKAGIFPSISGFNYYTNKAMRYELFRDELKQFNDETGTNNLILSLSLQNILEDNFLEELCSTSSFTHIEVIDESLYLSTSQEKNESQLEKFYYRMSELKSLDIIPIFKVLSPGNWIQKIEPIRNVFAGSILKSSDAAGSVYTKNRFSLIDEFKYLKEFSPKTVFVPTGGISTSDQVNEFINAGAEIVGVGSYFITAEECSIANSVKQKIIESSIADLGSFKNHNIEHNALIFSEFSKDDSNHTASLLAGISGTSVGHVYMSKSVNNIREIKPLKDLVAELLEI